MSGMSGGGYVPSESQNERSFDCSLLSITTALASPNATVLAHVRVNDILIVSAESERGPVCIYKEDEKVGAILHKDLLKLINCINEGTEYEAKVFEVEGGKCVVKISVKR